MNSSLGDFLRQSIGQGTMINEWLTANVFFSGLRRAILTQENAPYRLVILKQRFPDSTRKTIVRNAVKCIVLTIVNSHGFLAMAKKPGSIRSRNHSWQR